MQKLDTSMKVINNVNHTSVSLEGNTARRRGTCGLYTLGGYTILTYEGDDLIS